MYVYYYLEDLHLDDMPEGFILKKGSVSFVSEDKDLSVDLGCVEIDLNDEQMHNLAFLKYDENHHEVYIDEDEKKNYQMDKLKEKRKSLLIAFDKYKSNIQYGIQQETEQQKETILKWYQKVLDLDAEAIHNPPKEIAYYL